MSTPSKALLALEAARCIYEYGLGWALNVPLQYISPKGDGHPVIIFPGLGTSDTSTHYLRNFLGTLGYQAYSWGQGRNCGPREGLEKLLSDLDNRLAEIADLHDGQQISLIGWSLGGIYARELSKRNPTKVRSVITLGTPFMGEPGATNATFLYELLSKDTSHRDPNLIKSIAEPVPVPFTSIYSKSDGVVAWDCSIETQGTNFENVEVPGGSHLGLGHNPISMHIIADRLSQPIGAWKPYKI